MNSISLADLPDELIIHIIGFLPAQDVLKFSEVNLRINELCQSPFLDLSIARPTSKLLSEFRIVLRDIVRSNPLTDKKIKHKLFEILLANVWDMEGVEDEECMMAAIIEKCEHDIVWDNSSFKIEFNKENKDKSHTVILISKLIRSEKFVFDGEFYSYQEKHSYIFTPIGVFENNIWEVCFDKKNSKLIQRMVKVAENLTKDCLLIYEKKVKVNPSKDYSYDKKMLIQTHSKALESRPNCCLF